MQSRENIIAIKDPNYQPVQRCRTGLLQLRVGTYWMFRESQRPGEDDDLSMFRLIRERNHFKKWTYILAAATALAVILAVYP